jgi:pilus assembly protein CpaB
VKRRMIGIVGAVVLALLGTVVLVSYVKGAEDRALAGEKTVKVLVAAEPIDAGTPADELEGKVEFERIPQKVRAEGAITSLRQLGDRVAETDLLPNEQVVKGRFVEGTGSGAPGAQEGENLLQATVALEPERALGGVIKPGDLVGVVSSYDPFDSPDGTKSPNQTHVLLHKVRVTNVQVETSPGSSSGEAAEPEGDQAGEAPSGRFLISLAASAPDVERIVFTAEFGHIWLVAEPRDAEEAGAKTVVLENVYA